jgi:beta-galactosidase
VRTAPIAAKAERVVYVGDDQGAKTLDDLGVVYTKADAAPADAQVIVIGGGASVPLDAARNGAKVLVLARAAGDAPAGVTIQERADYQGSNNPPAWPEAAGLSPSDLRWKSKYAGRVITAAPDGAEVAADGSLARQQVGAGVVIYSQVDPAYLPADEKRYFRFTRWRQTRALAQLLSNLGASFKQDAAFLALLQKPEQGYMLAGQWEAQQTVTLKESPYREWNAAQPISDEAKALITAGTGGNGWQKVSVPAFFESYGPKWKNTDGEVVFRKVIDVPDYMAGRDMFLSVGRVDETEETFVNGTSVGSSRHWILPRGHRVPGNLIKPGKNVIVVRNWDEGIHGGMCGAADLIFLRSNVADAGFYHPDYISDRTDESTDESGWAANRERSKSLIIRIGTIAGKSGPLVGDFELASRPTGVGVGDGTASATGRGGSGTACSVAGSSRTPPGRRSPRRLGRSPSVVLAPGEGGRGGSLRRECGRARGGSATPGRAATG